MHNIKLTTEQFKTLLKLVYLGEWIVNGHKNNPDPEFDELSRYLFSLTKKFKIGNISIDEDPEYPTADYESGEVREYIENYDELTFWDELVNKLTNKIMAEQHSKKQLEGLEVRERFRLFCNIQEKVKKHLQQNGLNQIVLESAAKSLSFK